MSQSICPFLITVDQDYNQGPPIDYPSFENRCQAGAESDMLLFPHQATFCLSDGHRVCPLFKATRAAAKKLDQKQGYEQWQPVRKGNALRRKTGRQGDKETGRQGDGEQLLEVEDSLIGYEETSSTLPPSSNLQMQDLSVEAGDLGFAALDSEVVTDRSTDEWLANRRSWSWLGAAAAFVVVMFFGALTAAWVGWNFANAQLETQPGRLSIAPPNPSQPNQASSLPLEATTQAVPYVIWTATSPANVGVPAQNAAQQNSAQQPDPNLTFPVAVTATPIPANNQASIPVDQANGSQNNGNQNNSDEAPLIVVQPQNPAFVPIQGNEQVLPDIQVEIPTRRETPAINISVDQTAVALAEVPETPTETPTPLGTPVVIFGADVQLIKPGGCTIVRWSVQNVSEVYYDNMGVYGKGEKEECVNDRDGIYLLRVVLPNGAISIYTTTVTVEQPTPTPTITPTFTPEPIFTATWTPIPPTSTATPNIRRSVTLEVQGGTAHSCAANSTCAIGLLTSNTGDQIDDLTVSKVAGDGWGVLLCRNDGVCGAQVPLISVGPTNTVFLELRLSIPGDAASGSKQSYQLLASSNGSGGSVTSATVSVEVVVQ